MRVRLRSSAIDSYKVAADRPRLITIAAIGAALIDGHDIGATSNGVFAKLGNLKPGQMIAIVNNYLKVIRQGKKIAQDHRIIVRADLAK